MSKLSPPDIISIVSEFFDVFPEELPGLPPQRIIVFAIDLVRGTNPISIAPYRRDAMDLREINNQIQ